jgi:hypothetical protein
MLEHTFLVPVMGTVCILLIIQHKVIRIFLNVITSLGQPPDFMTPLMSLHILIIAGYEKQNIQKMLQKLKKVLMA